MMRRLIVPTVLLVLGALAVPVAGTGEAPSAAGSFGSTGPLAKARAWHTATVLPDGRVLVVGGQGHDMRRLRSVEVWDPATSASGPTGRLAMVHLAHTATLLPDGRVLVVGGLTKGGSSTSEAEVWDPVTGSFESAGALIEARAWHTATALADSRVLVFGGEGGGGRLVPATAEVWDPATASFAPAGSIPEVRFGHTATALPDGRVLMVISHGDEACECYLGAALLWDPAGASFTPTGAPIEVRHFHTATLLPDGRVLVVGGAGEGERSLASAEVWDPATGSFTPAGSLVEARQRHDAALLPDGRVLVVAGLGVPGDGGDTPALTSAEIWDPGTGMFSLAGSLTKVRMLHTVTALLDGRVLVLGGAADGEALASAEVWQATP